MLRLLRSEIFRLRKRPQSWVLGIIMLGGVATVYVGLVVAAFLMSDDREPKRLIQPAQLFESGMQLASGLGFLLVAIVAASLIGNEYSWGTIRPLVSRAPNRHAIISAKLITLLMYSTCLLLVGLVACLACSIVGTLVVGGALGIDGGLVGDWSLSFVRMMLAQLPYAALTFFATLLARSTAVGIGVGIGIGVLEAAVWGLAGLVTDAFETIRKFGLDYPSTQLFNMNAGTDSVSASEASQAVVTMVVWTILFVATSYYVFNRRDVTTG
jgi:ABC-type transport system involved in multi-copper enzyme maturation permease subunit